MVQTETAASTWVGVRSMSRSRLYPVIGVLVTLAAPLGLLCTRAVAAGRVPTVTWMREDLARLPETYLYVTLATVVVLTLLGYVLGQAFDRTRLLSITDPLTGLFNRRHFGERLTAEILRGRRHGHATSVLCVDIDSLKAINDGLGHHAGDRALLVAGRALASNVRAIDTVARIGGDEFAVLLPRTSSSQAAALSERILTQVARLRDASTGNLTVSIGIAELDAASCLQFDDLLAAADVALYRAKAAGGARIAVAPSWPLRIKRHTLGEAALLIQNRSNGEERRS